MEVTLIIHSVDGAREVPLTGSRLTLGRAEPADVVINDQSLSRVHASINRDGDRVWIIDEGSTNGSLVNGAAVPASGTPLRDGDEIYLGNTTVVVSFRQNISTLSPLEGAQVTAPASSGVRWITGRPAAGKSTLAKMLAEELKLRRFAGSYCRSVLVVECVGGRQ